jgi:hypothetical protein
MMKKLLLMGAVLLAVNCSVRAQALSTPTLVTDTLHYYLNKYYFKSSTPSLTNFPVYKSAASTVTNVTHIGCRFEVPSSDSVLVTGLESYAYRSYTNFSPKNKVHLYLCNLNANNLPVLPPIDSIMTEVGVGALYSVNSPSLIGGNFRKKLPNGTFKDTSYWMKGDYAVLIRNMQAISGDSVFVLRTNGATYTNQAAGWERKASDSYGYVRYLAQFYSATNFTATGFGVGTDYEFVVAPRVQYNIQAGHILPPPVVNSETVCTRTVFNFTNISSKFYTHRMYNLNEFYKKWNLYAPFLSQPQTGGGFSADSSITWFFEVDDNLTPPRDPRKFLPYGASSVSWSSDIPGCFEDNELRARLRPMQALGRGVQRFYNERFAICQEYCFDDVGLTSYNAFSNLKLAPNPLANGETQITGLVGKNTLTVFNTLGQIVWKKEIETATAEIDLSSLPAGTYLMRVNNEAGESRTLRLLNQ